MHVQIVLDRPHHAAPFTNLDVIAGRVVLRNLSNTNVNAIVVKLEGEARTRLVAAPRAGNERPKPVLEVHKLLYKVVTVFPTEGMRHEMAKASSYTLGVGQHEFPFAFKLPFNNACTATNSITTNMNFSGLGVEIAKTPTRHVKTTLPPSLNFPGEAEVRYYVKVTVNRPQLFRENPRAWANFNFVPIEPPRPATNGESYARRQHQFGPVAIDGRKKNMFDVFARKDSASAPPTPQPQQLLPRFSVDARLSNPAIITCGQDVPLRVLVKQLSERTEPVYLQMLQIELIGYTQVRAHDIMRTESNSWVIVSIGNIGLPLGSPSDVEGTETAISREFWHKHRLPNTVPPTFVTCNIARRYELEVRVGLGYGSSRQGKDQLTVLPLRMPVKVYSGIAPPLALLQATHSAPSTLRKPVRPPRPSSAGTDGYASMPPTPIDPSVQSAYFPPPQHGTPQSGPAAQEYEDAPPSYEDAIAEDLPPINGPRPDYAPPPPSAEEPRFSGDEKR